MEKEKNRIALSEILNEKGLQLLKEANKKIAQSPGPDAVPKKNGPCPGYDPNWGYAYIGGKCYYY